MESNFPISISIPFTIGVASGAALAHWGVQPLMSATASCLACTLAFALCLAIRAHDRPLLYVLLFSLGCFCYCNACLSAPAAPDSAPLEGLLEALRGFIRNIPFGSPTSGPLLEALMTGNRDGLPGDVLRNFRTAGASHLLALSGLHLGILAGVLNAMLSVLGRSRTAGVLRYGTVVTASAFYTVLCGAGPSLVRALLFIILTSVARLLPHRRPEKGGILCTALTLQLAFNPTVITSLAFQMSYLAVAGIVFILPELESWYPSDGRLGKKDPVRRLWQMMALGISCQLTTAPLAWIRFRSVPAFFLLTNLLAMPLCELLMVLSAGTLMLCAVTAAAPGTLSGAAVFLTDKISDLMLKVLEIIAGL